MKVDFERILMLLDIILKAAHVGLGETQHVVAAAHEELRAIHGELDEEKTQSRALIEAKIATDAANQPRSIPSSPALDDNSSIRRF